MASVDGNGSNTNENHGYNSLNDLLEGVEEVASDTDNSLNNTDESNISNEENLNEENSNVNSILEEEGVGEGDEIDEEPVVEGSAESAVQIAPTDNINPSLQNEDDPMLGIQLGDRIVIDSEMYKRTAGIVYYNGPDMMSIKPDGVEDMIRVFDMTEDGGFDEKYGVRNVYILEKRKFDSFVEQHDLRVQQQVDTFDKNGDPYRSYHVTQVDKEADSIVVQDLETEEEQEVIFDYIGIPSDMPFQVISVRSYAVGDNNEGAPAAEGADGEENEEKKAEEAQWEEAEDMEGVESVESVERIEGVDGMAPMEDEEGIEEIGFVEIVRPKVIREAVSSEQRFTDNVQKVDALNDFLTSLDPTLQKDPKAVRAVRTLVDTLFGLKQSTVEYNEDGSVRGPKILSATNLSDLVRHVAIPLGRPVLRITKKEYLISTEEDELKAEEKEEEVPIEQGDVYFTDFKAELNRALESGANLVSTNVKGVDGGQAIELWQNMRNYLRNYVSPWKASGEGEPLWRAIRDSELFRTAYPDLTEDAKGATQFVDTVSGYLASHSEKDDPIFDRVPFGIERALAATYRKGVERRKQLFVSEDEATMNNYLLFPLQAAPQLGATRSSSLAIDSGRAQLTRKTMKTILKELGAPTDVGTSNNIILLGNHASTFGNIPLADYIDGLTVPALGIGDVFQTLEQYGMDHLELTPDIVNVLLKKIEKYQEQLLSTLARLRTMLDKQPPKAPEANPFLENPSILDIITSEPLLMKDLEDFKRINPSLANSDLAQVAYLLQKHPDYFQVAAGKNPVLVAKALHSANNMFYLESLKIASILRFNEQNAGEKPRRNPCKHVADLVAVRRIHDNDERFQKMVELFRHYQGERKDNWIHCNLCKEHLLCLHERLQIQAFLNPKEKHTIDKEIALKFSGGQFQGNYICRNCGQAFRALDFDNNIEFDDEGRPKSGRAVLVDEDGLFQEKLESALSASVEPTIQEELKLSEEGRDIYVMIREITGRVGVEIDRKGYQFIIDHVLAFKQSNDFYTEQKYNQLRALKPRIAPYIQYKSTLIIGMTAAYTLLEIQTHTPPYLIRKPLMGCNSPGFDGYPLDNDIAKRQGIEYIACAISSIRKHDSVWSEADYYGIASDTDRQKKIIATMMIALKAPLANVNIATKLERARSYLADTIGAESQKGRPRDVIPATFLPQQIIVSPEDAAKDVIQPEVAAAMGAKGAMALVKLWIRQAHVIAKSTAALIRGSPLADTTCCLAAVNQPGTFWYHQAELPPIGKRMLTPLLQGQPLLTPFTPRPASSIVAEPNKDEYYMIFLKCCFTGPRKGYPHEPGLDNLCPWCGFQFPSMPSVMDATTEGKGALVSQNIETDSNAFVNLLDAVHTANRVQPIPPKSVVTNAEVIAEFGDIQPPPVAGWNEILTTTYENFEKLAQDDIADILLAAGPISDVARMVKDSVMKRFKPRHQAILEKVATLPWMNFFQVLQSYFLVPFERKIVDFNAESLPVPYELKKTLVDDHIKDIQKILAVDQEVVTYKQDQLKQDDYRIARAKMEYFVKQLRMILPFKHQIGPKTIHHGMRALQFIQEILLYGPLSTLLDVNQLPPGVESRGRNDPSKTLLFEYVGGSLIKYNKEYLSYNDKEIKEKLEIRNEKERTMVLERFNRLPEEERKMELTLKTLRMGKWSIGKKISTYNEEVQRIEREQRMDMGMLTEENQSSAFEDMEEYAGPHMDADGNMVYDDEYYEREGGYDVNQHPDDDE